MKKIFCCILMAIIILTATSTFASVTLYEKTETERISSGAILKKYKLFTSDGWISVNMIEVDLEDENTEIGLLNSENGLSTFQTVFQRYKLNYYFQYIFFQIQNYLQQYT